MSLTSALLTAVGSLQLNQARLAVTSNNVANVNTEGYSRKIVSSESVVLAGQGAGVRLSDIGRNVNEFLLQDLRTQISLSRKDGTLDRFYTRMQDLFGTPGNDASLDAAVTALGTAMEALAVAPEDPVRRQEVINAAVALTQKFNTLANDIQTLRLQADQEIVTAVETVDEQLAIIKDLNTQIARNKGIGQPTADLEDKRDLAINRISEFMNVSHFTRDTGEVVILTASGRALLDRQARTLTHDAATAMDASISYPATIDGIDLDGADITSEITGGKIGALIELRDTILPNLNAELDTLATQIADQINAIHNDGVAFPPPNSLTGTTVVAGADPFAGTGNVRIAVVDSTGAAVEVLDLDLTTLATVGDAVTAIDAMTNASASIDANGNLVVSADAATNGIAINEMDSAVGTRGFSHFFGLNDFFVTNNATSSAAGLGVRGDIVGNPALIARGELESGALAPGDVAMTAGDVRVAQRLASKFSESLTFAASGDLPATTTTLDGYATAILALNASQAASVSDRFEFEKTLVEDLTNKVASISGVNLDEELATLTLLQNAYAASARMLSVASDMFEVLANTV